MSNRIPDLRDFKVMEKTTSAGAAAEPDVTVVTVVFNAVKSGRGQEFVQCLDSVQAQRGCRLEHVIVDGASKDGTRELIENHAGGEVPIRWLSEPDHGIYEAMNRGIALARGRFVVFLNSDDFFSDPTGMAESVRALDAAAADYSYASAKVIDDHGPVTHVFTEANESVTMLQGMTICHQTILFRRSVLQKLDGYDLTYRSAADYDLFLRFIYQGYKGVRVDCQFATFRAGGFSTVNSELSEKEVDAIFLKLFTGHFNYDAAGRAVRIMRQTGEYPTFLMDRILAIGRASFVRPILPACVRTPIWAHRTYGELVYAVRDWLWARTASVPSPESAPGGLAEILRFLAAHPLRFLAALKAYLRPGADGRSPLANRLRDRCEELALENFTFVAPRDIVQTSDQAKCFRYGIGYDRTFSAPISRAGACDTLALVLSACAYGTADGVVEVRCGGTKVGTATLKLLDQPRLHVFTLPPECRGGGDRMIEVKPVNGGDFVWGGMAIGHRV